MTPPRVPDAKLTEMIETYKGAPNLRSILLELRERRKREEIHAEVLAALKDRMNLWNSADAHGTSKRAQKRRGESWDRAMNAIRRAESLRTHAQKKGE